MASRSVLFILIWSFAACIFVQGSTNGNLAAHIKNQIREGFRKLETIEYENIPISKACARAMTTYTVAGTMSEEWALKMISSDSSLDALPGILYGNRVALGAHDLCHTVRATYKEIEDPWNGTVVGVHDFDAKYCRLDYGLLFGEKTYVEYTEGVCVPVSCNEDDVMQLYMPVQVPVKRVICRPERDVKKDTGALISIAVLAIFGLLVVVASIFDYITTEIVERKKLKMDSGCLDLPPLKSDTKLEIKRTIGKPSRALISFSLYTNAPRLFSTRSPPGAFKVMNGLRFMAMSWIVLGHAWSNITPHISNPKMRDNLSPRFLHHILNNMPLSVDMFLVLGGSLVMVSFLKTLKRIQTEMHGLSRCRRVILALKEYGLYIFHRYWRLTPVFGFLMMYVAHIFVYTGDGPNFPTAELYSVARDCKKNWWVNMIYLQNFLGLDAMCMGWGWYLAVDFQFYLLAPLHAWLFTKSPVIGGLFAALCWSLSLAARLALELIPAVDNSFYNYYIKPATRYGPYVIGMVLGFILHRTKARVKLPKFFVLCGWFLAFGFTMLAVFGNYKRDCEVGVNGCIGWPGNLRSIWYACHRDMFALGLAWIIFACLSGYGGPLNRFLSWDLWTPLSKLTYSGYLIHLLVQDYALLTRRSMFYLQDISIMYLYFGNFVLSLLLAVIVTLVFEIPFIELEKVIIPKKKKA